MTQYPLLYGYRDLIAGDGFLAGVAIDGRALIIEDKLGIWIHGVTPGGISADGASQKEAAAEFRSVYRAVLYDIAIEADGFEGFQAQVVRFFDDENSVLAVAWQEAVDAVRSGSVLSDWLEKQPADSPRGVHVIHISESHVEELANGHPDARRPKASLNALDRALLAA